MPLEERKHLLQVGRLCFFFRERCGDVIVNQNHKPYLGGEIQDSIERTDSDSVNGEEDEFFRPYFSQNVFAQGIRSQ